MNLRNSEARQTCVDALIILYKAAFDGLDKLCQLRDFMTSGPDVPSNTGTGVITKSERTCYTNMIPPCSTIQEVDKKFESQLSNIWLHQKNRSSFDNLAMFPSALPNQQSTHAEDIPNGNHQGFPMMSEKPPLPTSLRGSTFNAIPSTSSTYTDANGICITQSRKGDIVQILVQNVGENRILVTNALFSMPIDLPQDITQLQSQLLSDPSTSSSLKQKSIRSDDNIPQSNLPFTAQFQEAKKTQVPLPLNQLQSQHPGQVRTDDNIPSTKTVTGGIQSHKFDRTSFNVPHSIAEVEQLQLQLQPGHDDNALPQPTQSQSQLQPQSQPQHYTAPSNSNDVHTPKNCSQGTHSNLHAGSCLNTDCSVQSLDSRIRRWSDAMPLQNFLTPISVRSRELQAQGKQFSPSYILFTFRLETVGIDSHHAFTTSGHVVPTSIDVSSQSQLDPQEQLSQQSQPLDDMKVYRLLDISSNTTANNSSLVGSDNLASHRSERKERGAEKRTKNQGSDVSDVNVLANNVLPSIDSLGVVNLVDTPDSTRAQTPFSFSFSQNNTQSETNPSHDSVKRLKTNSGNAISGKSSDFILPQSTEAPVCISLKLKIMNS